MDTADTGGNMGGTVGKARRAVSTTKIRKSDKSDNVRTASRIEAGGWRRSGYVFPAAAHACGEAKERSA